VGLTAFVTGATGFVGSAVVRKLLAAGFDVRALVRPGTDIANIKGLSVELIRGDVRDAGSFRPAMANCSAVFHVAADYRLWVRRPREMYKTNVDGTRKVLGGAPTGCDQLHHVPVL
jgi:dihydroflavonol-4-reductase